MIDGHIHFENQPYTLQTIDLMVDCAIKNNIDTIYLLDHTHKFNEFDFIYKKEITEPISRSVYLNGTKNRISINKYIEFINKIRARTYPIKIKFGLEVCYFVNSEKDIKKLLDQYKDIFDFYVGSIHHVFGGYVDYSSEIQLIHNIDDYYREYFYIADKIIESKLFTFIAHLDLIKKFDNFPSFDLNPWYEHIAKKLHDYNQETENNSGLLRFGYPYGGMDEKLIKALIKYDVKFHKSSDAHNAEDIGRSFDKLVSNI